MALRHSSYETRPGFWPAEELQRLRDLAASGMRASIIAETLQRTEASVRGKAMGCGIDLVSERSPKPVTLRRLRLGDTAALEF